MDESDVTGSLPQEKGALPSQPERATMPPESIHDDREEPKTSSGLSSDDTGKEPKQPLQQDAVLLVDQGSPEEGEHPTPVEPHSYQRVTRRQVLMGIGVTAGVAAIGGSITLAVLTSASSPGTVSSSASPPAGSSPSGSSPPSQGAPSPLDQKLQAWRTKHLTVPRAQRFNHHAGPSLVPLGVIEPTYPNPYNPYHIHLQGYVLGGVLVAHTQFFLYLGLEAVDGTQFVGKFRVGPIDQTAKNFGTSVIQQGTDDIEGGVPDYPLVILPPKALYQALSALVDHCIVVDLIRKPLPVGAEGVPQNMRLEINQQATLSDQFLQMDFEAIHHTPLARISANELASIRHLIDASPITYNAPADAGRYPLVTQIILRHTDQLFPKLISGG